MLIFRMLRNKRGQWQSQNKNFHKMLECMKLQSVAAMTGIEFPSLQCLLKIFFTFCWDRILVVHSLFKTISYSASSCCSSTFNDSKMASYYQKHKFLNIFEPYLDIVVLFLQRKYLKIINYRASYIHVIVKRRSWSDNFWFYVL